MSLHHRKAARQLLRSLFRSLPTGRGRGADLRLVRLETRSLPATFLVTTTADSGPGSLRQAILDANATTAADEIHFAIGSGVRTIAPLTRLPGITNPVTIDGTTQPGFGGTPIIELNGTTVGPGPSGIWIGTPGGAPTIGSGTTIRGLVINRWGGNGIEVFSNGNSIKGCYIGTDVAGTVDLGNRFAGVRFSGGSNNIVGGTTAADRNVISGNDAWGVFITGGGSGNVVAGNYVGTDTLGTGRIANGEGVSVTGAGAMNVVGGGAGAGNVISGNGGNGVVLSGTTTATRVRGNLVGTTASGSAALSNGGNGLVVFNSAANIIGGTAAVDRNVISANGTWGLVITGSGATGNAVQGNVVGLTAAGTGRLGNSVSGIWLYDGAANNVVGGTVPGSGNVVSANRDHGVQLGDGSHHNLVQGNLLGTDATGVVALGNGGRGLVIGGTSAGGSWSNQVGGSVPGSRNVISGNGLGGVQVFGVATTGNTIAGNYIGTTAAGTAALANTGDGVFIHAGASQNVVGTNGDGAGDAAEGNVISGNAADGVQVSSAGTTGNVIAGNFIGTDVTGTVAVPNDIGIHLSTDSSETRIGTNGNGVGDHAERNVISGNMSAIFIRTGARRNVVAGNLIGTDLTGTSPVPNAGGVRIFNSTSTDNRIGTNGDGVNDAAEANTIAYHALDGVTNRDDAGGNSIRGNSVHSNGGLGIDLGPAGVTPNDPLDLDIGANGLQNHPLIHEAFAGAATRVTGSVNSVANTTYALDFYRSPSADPSGFGEGQTYLGSLTVTTDATGTASFDRTFAIASAPGEVVSATATDPAGNTSEFSEARLVTSGPLPVTFVVTTHGVSAVALVSLTQPESSATLRTNPDGSIRVQTSADPDGPGPLPPVVTSSTLMAVDLAAGLAALGLPPGAFAGFQVDGSSGNDSVDASALTTAAVLVDGQAGDDVLIGGALADTLIGGAGNDTLRGGTGADVLAGGTGIDTVDYSEDTAGILVNLQFQTASGGNAAGDQLVGFENVTGGSGTDLLFGDNAPNVVIGNGGDDTIYLLSGDDTAFGGDGNDVIDAGKGNDRTDGGAGNDQVLGRAGDDTLVGGVGNDRLSGDQGQDVLNGGVGADDLDAGLGSDRFVMNYTDVTETGAGSDQDRYVGGNGSDAFEFRGCTVTMGGVLVLDPAKVDAMRAYLAAIVAAGQTDYNENVDSAVFVLIPEGPI